MRWFLLILTVFVIDWSFSYADLSADSRASIADTQYNFGRIMQGQSINTKFVLHNIGSDTLIVEKIEFSAPGMNARIKQRIEPDEKTDIHIVWDTSRLRRDIEGQAILHLNDPVMPRLILSISGTVTPAIEFLPKPVFYFSQYQGESQSQTISIRNNQESLLEIMKAEASSKKFEFDIEEVEQGKIFELTVSVKEDAPIGRFEDSLLIHSNDAARPTLYVGVNILVKPDVFINPEMVDFGRLSVSQMQRNAGLTDFIQQTVVISRREGRMNAESVSSDLPYLKTQISSERGSAYIVLEAGIDPEKLVTGPISGSIKIKTDNPKHPELIIPVLGEIAD